MFISKIRASDDRSPWGDFWFEPVSIRTMSGVRVGPDTAMQLSAVFRAVQLVSGHFAMLPMILKQAGKLKRLAAHPLLTLFKKPNQWQNGFEWRQMNMGHLLLRGNAYNEIVDNSRGEILALIPRNPDRVKIEQLPDGDYRYRVTDADGTQRIVARGKMWHLRGLSSNGITGLSVLECARESLGLGISAQAYGSRFFANDARPGGVIEFAGKFADKNARQVFRESWQEAQAGANRGKVAVLENGMSYKELGVTNKDSQFLETRKFQISDIARWFGIPPHKLGDLDRATFSNIEQMALEYITDSLLIWTEIWEAAVEDGLLFDSENLEVEFDFTRLMRGDSTSRANFAQKAILTGYMTRNEARAIEGWEPLDGLDEPMRPLNMVEESDAEDMEADQEQAEPPAQESKEPADDKEARMSALLRANAARLARRLAKSGTFDAELVAEGLAISVEAANAWFAASPAAKTLEELTDALFALGTTS